MRLKRINESISKKDFKLSNDWDIYPDEPYSENAHEYQDCKFRNWRNSIYVVINFRDGIPQSVSINCGNKNFYKRSISRDVYSILDSVDKACSRIKSYTKPIFGDAPVGALFRLVDILRNNYLGGDNENDAVRHWYDTMRDEISKALK